MVGIAQQAIGFAFIVAGALILGAHNNTSFGQACGYTILASGIVICVRAPKE